jgi:hypothetical protein
MRDYAQRDRLKCGKCFRAEGFERSLLCRTAHSPDAPAGCSSQRGRWHDRSRFWTLESLVEAYRQHQQRVRGLRQPTLRDYERFARSFLQFALDEDPLDPARLTPRRPDIFKEHWETRRCSVLAGDPTRRRSTSRLAPGATPSIQYATTAPTAAASENLETRRRG